jgi:hypothetical protein
MKKLSKQFLKTNAKEILETRVEEEQKIRQKAIKIFIRKKIIEITIGISGIAALIFVPYFIGYFAFKIFGDTHEIKPIIWYFGFVILSVVSLIIWMVYNWLKANWKDSLSEARIK